MSVRHIAFAPGEYFHCCTRGVDKRQIFMDERDCERFQMLLYTCNSTRPIHISNLHHPARQGPALGHVLAWKRGERLVDIGAYCLMPSHPHLLLRERDYGGISSFMQKVGTGYTMYFNKKYSRTGALFSGRFKAMHVATDQYLQRVVNYIHANAAELYEPQWKKGVVANKHKLKQQLSSYEFSSLPDYDGNKRAANVIINKTAMLDVLERRPSFET